MKKVSQRAAQKVESVYRLIGKSAINVSHLTFQIFGHTEFHTNTQSGLSEEELSLEAKRGPYNLYVMSEWNHNMGLRNLG